MIDDEIYYYPLVQSPFGKVPLVGATMTDEREKELAEKYPMRKTARRCFAVWMLLMHLAKTTPAGLMQNTARR